MTVGELIEMLQIFPPQFPVFLCPESDGFDDCHAVISPVDAVMNLVAESQHSAMGFNGVSADSTDMIDAVVIYPVNVRDRE